MKTYRERTECVNRKIKLLQRQRTKRRNIITTTCLLTIFTVLALVLFVPYNTNPPDVSEFKNSPYYDLIQKINAASYQKPFYKNNFHYLLSQVEKTMTNGTFDGDIMFEPADTPNAAVKPGTNAPSEEASDNYVEITDNQVAGVTEADIIKRSDKYIFYLRDFTLSVYSIEGLDSKAVGKFDLNNDPNMQIFGPAEMYLSTDCTTLTVIHSGVTMQNQKSAHVIIRNLDITDPKSIRQIGIACISGSVISSRFVDGKLLVISNYRLSANKDFHDESTFLPQAGQPGNMVSVDAEKIIAPEDPNSLQYTVITAMDGKTLEIQDNAAFLSFSQELYVSRDHIFATRNYTETLEHGDYIWRSLTEISCIGYSEGKLLYKGSVKVAGTVKNQYSMDEHEGILRVVTSLNDMVHVKTGDDGISNRTQRVRNASLYCVSLEDFSIVAAVENFAPEGEQAESVRFDGDTAYVCTAEVITMTDPVYFFDLSDLKNITWKDTGTIDGYSSSLVDFGDGFLLGIGYGASRNLKIEVYEESDTGVTSVCAFELDASFSENYKSYLIDRKNGYIGLGIRKWAEGSEYILLHFDGYRLTLVEEVPMNGSYDLMRGVLIDNFLYILGHSFQVTKLW